MNHSDDDAYQDGIRLPMKDDSQLLSPVSPEIAEWMNKELYRVQVEMYNLGKVDCLKSFDVAIKSMMDEAVTKENVLMLINNILERIEVKK